MESGSTDLHKFAQFFNLNFGRTRRLTSHRRVRVLVALLVGSLAMDLVLFHSTILALTGLVANAMVFVYLLLHDKEDPDLAHRASRESPRQPVPLSAEPLVEGSEQPYSEIRAGSVHWRRDTVAGTIETTFGQTENKSLRCDLTATSDQRLLVGLKTADGSPQDFAGVSASAKIWPRRYERAGGRGIVAFATEVADRQNMQPFPSNASETPFPCPPRPMLLKSVTLQDTRTMGLTSYVMPQKRVLEARDRKIRHSNEWADRDPVTSLLNHRAFFRCFENAVAHAGGEGGTFAVVLIDIDNFRNLNRAYSRSIGDDILRQVAGCLEAACFDGDIVARFGGDEFALILRCSPVDSDASSVEQRVRMQLNDLVYLPPGAARPIPITAAVGAAFPTIADRHGKCCHAVEHAESRMRHSNRSPAVSPELLRILHTGYQRTGFAALDALVTAVDNKDRYTRLHSEDVLRYSLMIARELRLPEETIENIGLAAILHDVGKIGIPDAILRKPGPLTREEFEAIKQHSLIGAAIVGAIPGLEATLDVIRHHHERWDGAGYPDQLLRGDTPFAARLVAVADAFSAMTTSRPYCRAVRADVAQGILEAGAGVQWDPRCVQAFLRASRFDVRQVHTHNDGNSIECVAKQQKQTNKSGPVGSRESM